MGFDEGLTHCRLLFEADGETTQRHEGTPDLTQYVEIVAYSNRGQGFSGDSPAPARTGRGPKSYRDPSSSGRRR